MAKMTRAHSAALHARSCGMASFKAKQCDFAGCFQQENQGEP